MRIMMPDKLLKTSTHFFKPFNRYVVSDYELDEVLVQAPKTQVRWSSFNSYERRCPGTDLNGKMICVYRHNAFGDQLIASALPRYIKTHFPAATVHLYCHPNVMPLWFGNPFVEGSAIPLPIPFDAVKEYDYHIFYEGMLEGNSEPDQGNCYDDMFAFAGFRDVPDNFKVPCVFPSPEDYEALVSLRDFDFNREEPYIVYHAAPDNMNRAYPPHLGVETVTALADRFPEMNIVIVGRDRKNQFCAMFDLPVPRYRRVKNLINRTKSFRDLIPIVESARLVVCPDSSILHLAASFPRVPIISLWGLFHPDDRAKYYTNNHPIFPRELCPHAPCHDHNFFLPKEQCKDAWGLKAVDKDRVRYCKVLAGIHPEHIVSEAEEILRCGTSSGREEKRLSAGTGRSMNSV